MHPYQEMYEEMYEQYFDALPEGAEVMSLAEFIESLS